MSIEDDILEFDNGYTGELFTAGEISFGEAKFSDKGNVIIIAGLPKFDDAIKNKFQKLYLENGKIAEPEYFCNSVTRYDRWKKELLELGFTSNFRNNPEQFSYLEEKFAWHGSKDKLYPNLEWYYSLFERKPNLIFVMPRLDYFQYRYFAEAARELEYGTENIHIVWVIDKPKNILNNINELDKKYPMMGIANFFERQMNEVEFVCRQCGEETKYDGSHDVTDSDGVTRLSPFIEFMNGEIWLAFNSNEDGGLFGFNDMTKLRHKGKPIHVDRQTLDRICACFKEYCKRKYDTEWFNWYKKLQE